MSDEKKFIRIEFDVLKLNIDQIMDNRIPVWRKNRENVFVVIPLDKLDQFIGDNARSDVEFYIEEKWETLIIKRAFSATTQPENDNTDSRKTEDTYIRKRIEIKNMPPAKREDHFRQILNSVNQINTAPGTIDNQMLTGILDAVTEAYAINKTSFEEVFEDDKNISSGHIRAISRDTTSLVQGIMNFLKNNRAANNFINMLGEKSTGSTVDHMNSVFLLFLSFCYFYNSYFIKGKISKIRSEFKKKYHYYYAKLIPHDPPDSLEDVFAGGMREIDQDKLLQYGIGAFLHDIGKIDNIDYFEGDMKYNKKIIMRHAPISYNMIIKTGEFDPDVALMAALHHEYYSNSAGYGLSKIIFPSSQKRYSQPHHCLSYNVADVRSGYAMAYVPAKILEIVDVFDALTDSKRKYRVAEFSVDEALEIMKNDFIVSSVKIDPILFNIFVDFIDSHAIMKDRDLLMKFISR